MNNKDLYAIMLFVFSMFFLMFAFVYFTAPDSSLAPDFIELPKSVIINPDLR